VVGDDAGVGVGYPRGHLMATQTRARAKASTNGKPPKGDAATILAQSNLKQDEVAVPEWNCTVIYRELSEQEVNDIQTECGEDGVPGVVTDVSKFRLLLVQKGCVVPEFTPDQLPLLKGQPFKAISTVATAVMTISGLRDEEGALSAEAFQV